MKVYKLNGFDFYRLILYTWSRKDVKNGLCNTVRKESIRRI